MPSPIVARCTPLAVSFLHTVVIGVADIKVIVRIEGDSAGSVEFPLTAAVRSPDFQEISVCIEYAYPVQVFVCQVDVSLAVHCTGCVPDKLAVLPPVKAECTVKLAVHIAYRDTHANFDDFH